MTAVEWLKQNIAHMIHSYDESDLEEFYQQALELEKQQSKQIVLNLLYHELGHDDTARWIAERLEAGEIDLNDL